MKFKLQYLYFIMAIAPLEALIGLSLQLIGPIIAYNVILLAAAIVISYAYYTLETPGPRKASSIIALLSLVKIASMILNLPILLDAIVDGALILSVVVAVTYIWPSKQSAFSSLLGFLGVALVTIRIGAITVIAGLILESASLILAGSMVAPANTS